MEISFNDLRNKEIINLMDGSKMGHVVDIVFSGESCKVLGVFIPGEKRFFKKSSEVFIPIEKIRRIGDDVILIRFDTSSLMNKYNLENKGVKAVSNKYYGVEMHKGGTSFIRYRKLDYKKYK